MSPVNKTIQDKMDELSQIIDWFDSEDFKLETALDKYRQAEKLTAEIENDLMGMKNEVNVIKQKFDSGATL